MPARKRISSRGRQTCIALVKANHPASLAQASRCPHSPAPSHRHLLRARGEGERPLDSIAPAHSGYCPALRTVYVARPPPAPFFDRKPAQEEPWTKKLWIYNLRTNLHFTLKENTLKRTDLDVLGKPGRCFASVTGRLLQPEEPPRAKANLVGEKRERPLARLQIRRLD
jgi:hypothetical protein